MTSQPDQEVFSWFPVHPDLPFEIRFLEENPDAIADILPGELGIIYDATREHLLSMDEDGRS